jgi:hypothetical protein
LTTRPSRRLRITVLDASDYSLSPGGRIARLILTDSSLWTLRTSQTCRKADPWVAAIGVAVFGILIVGDHGTIVSGMHIGALFSAIMLIGAANIAWIGHQMI